MGVRQTKRGLDLIEKVKQQGIAVIIITHHIAQAFQVTDRLIVLRQSMVEGIKNIHETTSDEIVSLLTVKIETTIVFIQFPHRTDTASYSQR
ncbi:MAG: hypothetical protein JW795_11735 [Chitinivibrionales bacterium]|nr:hypothetical protein [Chitinivibrionales bacterium]